MLNTKEKFGSGYVSVGDRFSEMIECDSGSPDLHAWYYRHWKVIVDVKENGEIVAIGNGSTISLSNGIITNIPFIPPINSHFSG
jgi:hypothetical protein